MSGARTTLIALLFGMAADLISIISELAPRKSALVDVGAINPQGSLNKYPSSLVSATYDCTRVGLLLSACR